MYIFNLLFALLFTLHLFFTSGYTVQWLTGRTTGTIPNALESITGYALTALLCFLSLFALGSLFYGGLIACLLSYAAAFSVYQQRAQVPKKRFKLTLNLIIKLAFLVVVLLIYLPCLLGQATKFHLPAIFDLPKQIAAIIAAAHATTWPAPNPYFPDLSFAYNLFFYLPLGLIARSLALGKLFIPLFVVAVLWITWQSLSLLEMIMEKFGLSRREQILGLLFATFISDLIPLMFSVDIPIGFTLHWLKLSDLWAEDPLIFTIYIPQYLFVSSCLFSAWLFFNTKDSWIRSLFFSLLLASAILAGYVLVPVTLLIFVLLTALDLFSSPTKSNYKKSFFSLILFVGLCGYFIWEAKGWSGTSAALLGWPKHYGWGYLILSELVLLLGCFLALFNLKAKKWNCLSFSYSLLVIPTLFVLFISHDFDIALKALLFLRLLLILPATVGFVSCWSRLKQRALLRWSLLIIPLSYLCCLSLISIGFLCANSYVLRDNYEKHMLRKMQKLAFDARILFAEPDMEKAAVSGHLVYMDFSGFRSDAYLPSKERSKALEFFHLSKSSLKLEDKKINAIYTNHNLVKSLGKPVQINSLSRLKEWQLWDSNPQSKISYKTTKRSINSGAHLVDAALITPLQLSEGTYQIFVKIKGKVEEGSAHLSLHGVQKLITIPTANYDKPAEFSAIFTVGAHGFNGVLAFGLGGWSSGRGSIQLNNLVINKFSSSSTGDA